MNTSMHKRLTAAILALTTVSLTAGGCGAARTGGSSAELVQPSSTVQQPSKPDGQPSGGQPSGSQQPGNLRSLGNCTADTDLNNPEEIEEAMDAAQFSETITITNYSHFRLTYKGISSETHGMGHFFFPLTDIAPGQSQKILYCSNNVGGGEVELFYAIPGVPDKNWLDGFFQVPNIGHNHWRCDGSRPTDRIVDKEVISTCSGSTGNHATFSWDIKSNPSSASFPDLTAMKEWNFHPYGHPSYNLVDTGQGVTVTGNLPGGPDPATWTFVPKDGDWGQLVNKKTGKCLEQNNTDQSVDTWDCVDQDNLLWRSVKSPTGGSYLQLKSTNAYLTMNPNDNSASLTQTPNKQSILSAS